MKQTHADEIIHIKRRIIRSNRRRWYAWLKTRTYHSFGFQAAKRRWYKRVSRSKYLTDLTEPSKSVNFSQIFSLKLILIDRVHFFNRCSISREISISIQSANVTKMMEMPRYNLFAASSTNICQKPWNNKIYWSNHWVTH